MRSGKQYNSERRRRIGAQSRLEHCRDQQQQEAGGAQGLSARRNAETLAAERKRGMIILSHIRTHARRYKTITSKYQA
ncbi:hypothetical protein AOLI_G00027230 [Acnodon oligacanthus]